MTRVLLFGGSGQLGTAIRQRSSARWTIVAPTSATVPLDDPAGLRACVLQHAPDAVVNAAAFTRVDDAERDAATAETINGVAPGVLAAAARDVGARFVHVSTDYVFDGTGAPPYRTDAPTSPVNVYGASKLTGERRVLAEYPGSAVVRTAWVHGGNGVNFVGTAVRLLLAGTSMRVVDDQIGTPTRAATLADAIERLVDRPAVGGLLHVTDAGVASWYDVACAVREELDALGVLPSQATVTAVSSDEFPRPARRPRVSILDTHQTRARLEWTPTHWRVGVMTSTREWVHSLHDA